MRDRDLVLSARVQMHDPVQIQHAMIAGRPGELRVAFFGAGVFECAANVA